MQGRSRIRPSFWTVNKLKRSRAERLIVADELPVRWIEPKDDVKSEDDRRRARYTTLALAVIVPIGAAATIVSAIEGGFGTTQGVMVLAVAILATLIPVSRGKRHDLAAMLALAVTAAAIWGSWTLAGASPEDADTLYFLALPLWMGSLLLRSSGATVLGAVNLIATIGITSWSYAAGAPEAGHLLPVPIFLALAGGLAVNAARLRDHDIERADALAAKLKEQERSRLEMLNTIAHDLASPLTPLKLQLKLVPKDKPLPPERLAIIQRNIGQMERLVTDVKDLARLDAGALRTDLKPCDLVEIVRGAAETFREDARARDIALVETAEGRLPISADAERLTQVVYNLVTNALKFTPPGGRVELRVHRDDGRAKVLVTDSGRGLTPEEMGRLFRPFSQVHDRSEVKERGTGLGLYISRGIAKAHGGDMHVESEGRGRGSTFVVTLPLAETHKAD